MTIKDFNKIVDERIALVKSSLVTKGDEYNLVEDRLDSFKKAGLIENCSPERALQGYLTKHIISIYDMINSEQQFTRDRWKEKIGDSINYLILLEALLEDSNNYLKEE